MLDLWLAIGHHLLIFALFGVLVAELVIVRAQADRNALLRVARLDIWYGIAAGAIVVVGFSRAIFAAKGWQYYEHNAFFWAKIATFALIAIISIWPTVSYLRWQRDETGPNPTQITAVRRLLWLQVWLFPLLLIFAAAMARGFGEM